MCARMHGNGTTPGRRGWGCYKGGVGLTHLYVFSVESPNAIHDQLGARAQLQVTLVAVDAALFQHLLDLLP